MNSNIYFNLYPIDKIIKDFNLDVLTTTTSACRNIAIVISDLYFQKDIIVSLESKIPTYLKKAHYRALTISCYSILEAIELEVGAKLLHERTREFKNRKERQTIEARWQKSFDSVIHITKDTERYYADFKKYRDNVHLSKNQSIENDSAYTAVIAQGRVNFMTQYLNYIYSNLKTKLGIERSREHE